MDYYFQLLANIGCYLLFAAILLQLASFIGSYSQKRKETK